MSLVGLSLQFNVIKTLRSSQCLTIRHSFKFLDYNIIFLSSESMIRRSIFDPKSIFLTVENLRFRLYVYSNFLTKKRFFFLLEPWVLFELLEAIIIVYHFCLFSLENKKFFHFSCQITCFSFFVFFITISHRMEKQQCEWAKIVSFGQLSDPFGALSVNVNLEGFIDFMFYMRALHKFPSSKSLFV